MEKIKIRKVYPEPVNIVLEERFKISVFNTL